MRKSLAIMLLTVTCCLVFSQEAKADVSTITEVSYYEPTNSIRAYAWTITDYSTLAYYTVAQWGYVSKNDVVQGDMFYNETFENSDLYYEEFFPYDPAADYTIEAYTHLILRYRHPIGDSYEDYYNYVQWTYGNSVYHPYYFGFTGPGPDAQIDYSTILLGTVFSIFTEGATAGQPDHVKVVSDTGQTQRSICGFPIRALEYQAVDSTGRRATRNRISIRERFYNASPPNWEIGGMWSTCTPGWITPSGCSLHDLGGKWPDTLYPGNDSNCSSPCGGQPFIQKWVWCPRGQPEKVLATNVLDITSERILINGVVQYNAGDELR